jgi:hypothetical protein
MSISLSVSEDSAVVSLPRMKVKYYIFSWFCLLFRRLFAICVTSCVNQNNVQNFKWIHSQKQMFDEQITAQWGVKSTTDDRFYQHIGLSNVRLFHLRKNKLRKPITKEEQSAWIFPNLKQKMPLLSYSRLSSIASKSPNN